MESPTIDDVIEKLVREIKDWLPLEGIMAVCARKSLKDVLELALAVKAGQDAAEEESNVKDQ